MKSNGLRFHFSLLDIDFVAAEDDRNILTDTHKVTCRASDLFCSGL